MSAVDEFSVGIAMCCAGSVFLVVILYIGVMDYAEGLVPLIGLAIFLHVSGLVLVLLSSIVHRWRTEQRMYYDWGLY